MSTGTLNGTSFPHLTDMGNAERLVRSFGRDLRYCWEWHRWLAWDGKRWSMQAGDVVHRHAKNTVRNLYAEASAISDDSARRAVAEHARKSERKCAITDLIDLARSEEGIPISHEELDTHPLLLNVSNGTVDLRTGGIRAHRQEDHLTKLAPVEYLVDATCPTWLAFLDRIFDRDSSLIGTVQRLCGMILTGETKDHVLPIFYGNGANGKTTLYERLMDILGPDYSTPAPRNLLMSRQQRHDTELALLHGMRLVVATETEQRGRLNEALVKQLTGGDRISARRMHEDYWQFIPTHKVILSTNHQPTVRGVDEGIWRRILLIPFAVTIPEAERDPDLPAKLNSELPGILRWCVDGCQAWQRDGLNISDTVRITTEVYRASQDHISEFTLSCVVRDATSRVGASELFKAYQVWCDGAGEECLTQKEFGNRMGDAGYEKKKSTGGRFAYLGVRLVDSGP